MPKKNHVLHKLAVLTIWFVGILLSLLCFVAAIELLLLYPPQDIQNLVNRFYADVGRTGLSYERLNLYVQVAKANWLAFFVPLVGVALTGWISASVFREEKENNSDLLEYYLQLERKKNADLQTHIATVDERLLRLHDQIEDAFVLISSDMRILHSNATALRLVREWGHSDEDVQILQQPVHAVFPGFATSGLRGGVQAVLNTDTVWEHEVFLDRLQKWLHVRLYSTNQGVFCLFRDITDMKESGDAEQAAAMVKDFSRYSPAAFAVVDKSWKYLLTSKSWAGTLGLEGAGELRGQSHRVLMPRFPGDWQNLEAKLQQGELVEKSATVVVVDQQEEWLSWRVAPWTNQYGKLAGYILFVEVVTDVQQAKQSQQTQRERERQLAYHDILTGLPNRQLFYDRLNMSIAQAYRHLSKVSLMFLDLDGFKAINDTLGHDIGDMLLKEVSQRLQKCVRQTDTVARLGGDEFTIILTDVGDASNAERIAQKLIQVVAEPYHLAGNEVKVSTSIGVAMYPSDATNMTELIKKADTAMYRAKNSGKNNYKFFETSADSEEKAGAYKDKAHEVHTPLKTKPVAKDDTEQELYLALQRGELELYFQPKYNLETNSLFGLEALLRWHHPTKGIIPPKDFLPVAEQTGLILPIGEWVMRSAALRTKEWLDQGIPPKLNVVVNLSARQLFDASLPQRIQRVLEKSGLDPAYLGIEVSEDILAQNPARALTVLERIREMRLTITMDGFGKGLVERDVLKKLPVDMLKIGMHLVHTVEQKESLETIKSIIKLAQALNTGVMAEGVETEDQLKRLKAEGCYNMQGYLLGQPAGYKEVPHFFRPIFSNGKFAPEVK